MYEVKCGTLLFWWTGGGICVQKYPFLPQGISGCKISVCFTSCSCGADFCAQEVPRVATASFAQQRLSLASCGVRLC